MELDDKFIATALEAKADYLISADQDLLDIKKYQGIKIIDAESFIKLFKNHLPGQLPKVFIQLILKIQI